MKASIALASILLLLVTEAFATDPTRPPSAAEIDAWLRGGQVEQTATPVVFRLQSVLLSDSRRIAVINGRRLSVGDVIDGARVSSIEAGRVVLEHNGENLPLSITVRSHGETDRE